MFTVATSNIIITDHDAQVNFIFGKSKLISFIDVWHGLPFKGRNSKAYDKFSYYKELWTNSPYMKNYLENNFEFGNTKIIETGFVMVLMTKPICTK